jgi:hypothetical protein
VLFAEDNYNDQVKAVEMDRECSMYEVDEACIQGFGGKVRRKMTTRKTRRRWEDNIRMDLRDIGWGGMDCINLAQDGDQWRALVNKVMNFRVS